MNILDPTRPEAREAKLRYLDADFQIILEGEFVRCAATGDPIPLSSLRYWNVLRQVPFKTAEAAFDALVRSGE
ncbi:DUF2093 domain-containing protein [Aestuariivirga sp.]|uniref:DUF2093 domain-containing protein n=1 Tax=Aestuariivirga sp. TaxID=2650926 RepID=UPI00391AD0C3